MIPGLSTVGVLRGRYLLHRLDLDQKYTARGVHIYDTARSLAVECSSDRAESGNAMLSDICIIWPRERIYFPLTGLDVANMNSGTNRDDFFVDCLE
jgi:hypothetical protein